MTVNFMNIAGLCWDIAGAGMLAKAVATTNAAKVWNLVATAWDFNRHQIAGIVEARTEAKFGFALLIVGFNGQVASDFTPGGPLALILGVIFLVEVFLIYWMSVKRFVAIGEQSVIEHHEAVVAANKARASAESEALTQSKRRA